MVLPGSVERTGQSCGGFELGYGIEVCGARFGPHSCSFSTRARCQLAFLLMPLCIACWQLSGHVFTRCARTQPQADELIVTANVGMPWGSLGLACGVVGCQRRRTIILFTPDTRFTAGGLRLRCLRLGRCIGHEKEHS